MRLHPCLPAPAVPSKPAPSASPSSLLSSWPEVERALEERGTRIEELRGEVDEGFQNRLGTRLMALYRDTRSPECFEALYTLAGPAVLQWIRGLLHRGLGHLDPFEILQDTFVNVYRYPSAFRAEHPGSFRVWVRTIAGNIVRRASKRRPRLSFQEMPEGLQEPEDLTENPERRIESHEQKRLLGSAWILFLNLYARAWDQLSQRDRRTLHLVEVEGLTYEEAGRILGVGRSNMKMIVFRSRKRIARHMRSFLSRQRMRMQRSGAA